MIRRLLLLLLLALAVPAAAETLKVPPVTLSPDKAYVVIEYRLAANTFAPKLPGSRKWMPLSFGLILARYDAERQDVRGLGRAAASALPGKQTAVEGFRNRAVQEAEGARLIVLELETDIWVVEGWGTTAFSLGSYSFRLEPGTVTDLGVVSAEPDWAEGDRAANMGDVFRSALLGPFAKKPAIAPMRVRFRPREPGDIALPEPLAAAARPVTFTAGARFGNYLGGLVNRIEGVNAAEIP